MPLKSSGGSTYRPKDAPLSVALDLTNFFIGLSYKSGVGRAVPLAAQVGEPGTGISDVPKVVHDAKAFLIELNSLGVHPQNISEDVMLYTFLLNADPGGVSPETLAERFLDRKLNAAAEQQAEATLAVAELMRPQIDAQELRSVYHEIDLPLSPVLRIWR